VIARARRRVRPDTLIGCADWVTVAVGAEMGGFAVADMIETAEEMLARGIAYWHASENRIVFLKRTEDGEVIQ
jgi:hypothetical protein